MAVTRAGDLSRPISIYTPRDDDGNQGRRWNRTGVGYASVTVKGAKSPPGTYAVSSPSVTFVLRRQRILVGDIIFWKHSFYMVTSVAETSTAFFTVTASLVRISDCATVDEEGVDAGEEFEGALCEKYLKYGEVNQGYAVNELTAILITPRGVQLPIGSNVRVGEKIFAVRLCHDTPVGGLEYEIWRTADL